MAPNAAQFIGRADEMQVLERAFATAAAGVTTTVLIGGDPGIGKSTLLAEAASRFAGRSLVASCVRMGGTQIPLAPVATLLRRLQRSDAELLATVPLLADWIRPGSATPIGHHDVLAATADLVTAAAEASTPLLFAVEDVHWADGATWDLVEYLARGLVDVPVVVAATYRTADADSEVELRRRIAELSRLPQASRVVLSGWSAAEVADRVEILLGAPPPLGLVSEVVSRGQGNPFFTEELVAARSAGHELPPVVADLISADLARLDDPARAVVGALAVLGRPARHDVLVAVAGLGDDAEPAIRTAVEAGIVHVADELYAVRHALISEVAYRSMLPGERRRRHRLAAEALRGGRGTQIDHVGELAVHLDRAGDLDAAFVALLEAADASEKVAPGAALEHLQRAIALWDDVPDVAQHDNLAHRLWQAAELASATRGNEAAVELAQRALTIGPPARGWAFGHERLGRYLWSTGRLEASTVEFERAHELVGSSTDPAELAPVFAGLGQAELTRGNYDAAEDYAQRALDVLDDPSLEPMAWVMSNRVLGLVVSHRGEPERGTTLCRRAVEAATSAQMRGLARIYYVQALLGAGRYDDAANTALDASADAVQSGIGYSFAGYLDALASEALIRLGRWSEAARLLARHDDEPKLPIGEMRLAIANAKLAVRMGDAEVAHRWLDAARRYPIDLWHESYRTAAIADVELVSRRWAEAAVAARRGLESPAGELLLWRVRFLNLLVHAEVEQTLDAMAAREDVDVDAVRSSWRSQVEAARQAAHEYDVSELREVIAYLAQADATIGRLSGPDPDAWRRAGDLWEELSDAWLTAVCRLREADAAAAVGEARRAEVALRAAHEIAARLGSSVLANQIEAVGRRARIDVEAPEVVVLPETTAERLGLTPREAEVLGHLAAGATNREIGELLYISEKTASVHVSNILRKLGVSTRVEAAAVAQRLGIDEI